MPLLHPAVIIVDQADVAADAFLPQQPARHSLVQGNSQVSANLTSPHPWTKVHDVFSNRSQHQVLLGKKVLELNVNENTTCIKR